MEGFERQFGSPEEEIAHLRKEIQKKEGAETAKADSYEEGRNESSPERAVITEYAERPSEQTLDDNFNARASEVEQIALDLAPEDHDETVQAFLRLALKKGVKHTLTAVRKTGNPHLEDDFHRMLAEYVKEERPPRGVSGRMERALNLSLFEIRVPRTESESDTAEAFKQTVAQMEQLFAGLRDLDAGQGNVRFSLELALENVGSEVKFFAAVPLGKREMFEKQLSALFPRAQLLDAHDDYNIFNAKGAFSGSIATLSKHGSYPINTSGSFSDDPLNTLVQAITELKNDGEGAAVQFVFAPRPAAKVEEFQQIREKLKQGARADEILSTRPRLARELSGLIFGQSKKDDDEREKNATKNEHIIDFITEKLEAGLYGVNIRIVASAEDETRANALRHTIESAFRQFDRAEGNSFGFNVLRKGVLHKMLHNFSFRLFESGHSLTLNHKECATMIHIPGPGTHAVATAGQGGQYEGAPPRELPQEGVLLGTSTHRGKNREVYLSPEDRLRHFYCIGQTGTGKSTLLKNMMIQDIQAGEGVCMIDPHGSDIDDVLAAVPKERHNDVIYFDPADTARPMGLNMLEFDRRFPEQKTFVVNEMLSIFNKLFDMKTVGGPMFEQYFRNAVLLALEGEEPATLLDISRVLVDADFRERKLARSTNPVVVQFWQEIAGKAGGEANLKNIVPYITSKFDTFLSNDIMRPIIAQRQSAFNFREVMDNKKILLVNLSKGRLGDINANLIGLIIVGKLLLAALSRAELRDADFPPFYLYLDEFQNVTTDSITTILSEARKYKLSLNLAHQFIAQVPEQIKDAVFGNVGSIASFRVGTDDADYLEKVFAPTFSARDIANVENRHAIVRLLVNGTPREAFQIETHQPIGGDEAQVEKLKQLSRDTFGNDRAEIEQNISAGYRQS